MRQTGFKKEHSLFPKFAFSEQFVRHKRDTGNDADREEQAAECKSAA